MIYSCEMTFPTTHWTVLAAATVHGDTVGRNALNELCGTYRAPVLAFFRARCGGREDAEDLTHQLFEQLIETRAWRRADRCRGQFRAYLLGIAHNALRNWRRAEAAAKRGDGQLPARLDLLAEAGWEAPAPDDDAALLFDREWAVAVLAAAWERVQARAGESPERSARFSVLRLFLPGSIPPPSYESAAHSLNCTPDHVRVLIHRLRAEFAETLRAEVASTVSDPAEVGAEMAHLRAVMSARDEVATRAAKDFL